MLYLHRQRESLNVLCRPFPLLCLLKASYCFFHDLHLYLGARAWFMALHWVGKTDVNIVVSSGS